MKVKLWSVILVTEAHKEIICIYNESSWYTAMHTRAGKDYDDKHDVSWRFNVVRMEWRDPGEQSKVASSENN